MTTPAPRGKHIALLYSSNLRGEYESCGCPVHPLGGFTRRGTVTDRARADADAVVQVDAGDLLLAPPFRSPNMQPPDTAEVERRAHLLLASMSRLGITAFTPGETDLLIGPRRLVELVRKHKVPVVSANLVDRDGRRLFDADKIVEAAGVKIGFFGVLDPPKDEEARWKEWGVSATDPAAALREEARSLRQRGADVVVALLHTAGGLSGARQLMGPIKGVDWVVLGHSGANLETPESAGEARLVEAMQMGKNLGRLDLHVVDGKLQFADRGQRAQLSNILDDHKKQLADVRKRAGEDKEARLKEYFDRQTKQLEEAIARESQLYAVLPAQIAGSWFENRVLPLEKTIPDHPGLAVLVHQYNQENARRAEKGLPVGVAYRPVAATATAAAYGHASSAPPPSGEENLSYAGSNACTACHAPAAKFWQTTKHAHALATLHKKGRDKDPGCVACHSTGYLQPGGTQNIGVAVARYADVGCESCHGPGLAHITAADKKASTRRKVDAVTCLGCHTPDQTNNGFDYPLFSKAIVGPGHGLP